MPTFRESLADVTRNAFCTISGPTSIGLAGLGQVYKQLGGFENGEDLIASANLLRAAQEGICNRPPDDIAPELTGGLPNGQCVGTTYFVSADVSINGGTPIFAGQGVGPGPVFRDKGANIPTGERDLIQDANGNLLTGGGTSAPGGTYELVNIVVTPTDGPDDCGGQDGQPPTFNPTDWTTPETINYDDNAGNPASEPVDLVFGPTAPDGNGGFSVPVAFNFDGGLQLFGDINIETGDITIGFGNSDGDGIQPTEPEELDPEADPEDLGLIVVGARVFSVVDIDATDATEIFQSGGNPNIWVPRLGHIAFLYKTPAGTAWGTDIPIKNTDQIIWSVRPAIAVRGTPNLGTSFSVRPLVVQACPESCC